MKHFLQLTQFSALWGNSNTRMRLSFRVIIYSLLLLALVSIAGVIRSVYEIPLDPKQLEYVLVFCGSLSNIVAIIGIAHEPLYFPSEHVTGTTDPKEHEQAKVRRWLTGAMMCLSFVLAWASYQFSTNIFGQYGTILIAAFALTIVCSALLDQIKRNASRSETCATMIALVFFLLALLMAPVFGFVKLEDSAGLQFVQPRISPYIHLCAVPLLYLVVDTTLHKSLDVAKNSVPLDFALLVTGFVCGLVGAALTDFGASPLSDSALFESGSAAVVLLVGNWVWLISTSPEK